MGKIITSMEVNVNIQEEKKLVDKELWHACAGPLVTVPREGELVYYFPQGHIEQVSNFPKPLVTGFTWKLFCM